MYIIECRKVVKVKQGIERFFFFLGNLLIFWILVQKLKTPYSKVL